MSDGRERARRLTERVAAAGWASKLGPGELAQVLGAIPRSDDPRVLVDQGTGDGAGVFRLDAATALVQTVDFFTPVVDEPEAFGAIAAANALSDVMGTGIVATALRAGAAPEGTVSAATREMTALNRQAAESALAHGVTGATDVTGFGLLGHAAAVARESRLTLEIDAEALPILPGALALAPRFQPGGLTANRREFEPRVAYEGCPDEALSALLYDPQTSGGLLLLVPPSEAEAVLAEVEGARIVGRTLPAGPKPLIVRACGGLRL